MEEEKQSDLTEQWNKTRIDGILIQLPPGPKYPHNELIC